jgi:zinc transport system ATP-binding protein
MAILECRDATFAYDGEDVLENVDFALNAGDYLCVVGENGSGKSTLIKGLLGLKAPRSGKIVMGEGLRSTEIGYLPSRPSCRRTFRPASGRWCSPGG